MDAAAERDLVERCRRGSAAAFEPLVRAYERPGLALARGMLGDADEAADAVQDAFVRAYDSLDRLRRGSRFGPWFRTILRNLCLDRLRAPRTARRESWPPPAAEPSVWNAPVGTDRIERAELTAAVHQALAELSDDHRVALTLKEMDGLSYAEIADTTGVSEGTVASRLHHARAALRRTLEARGITLEDVVR